MDVYLDNASSTKLCEEASGVMLGAMREDYGNPSSTHFMGRRAASLLSGARKDIADALGARPEEVYFTSGGTESDNWAVQCASAFPPSKGKHIITSAVEHDAVMNPVKKLESQGWNVTYLMPDKAGRITAQTFAEALREDTVFASVMLVNNETGAVNPVDKYAREIKRRRLKTLLHTDAVQGLCKIPFTVKDLGAGLVTVSAHKIHGPKGIGALYAGNDVKLQPMLLGGSQERGKRAGTEALPAILGFGEAARLGMSVLGEASSHVRALRDYTTRRISEELPGTPVNGEGDSPYLLNLSLPGHKSEVLMSFLESERICVSNAAACKKGARSRVLEAMRLGNDVIDGALRVSFSRYSTQDEAERFVQSLKKASLKLLKAR